jgi:hypothetical protein
LLHPIRIEPERLLERMDGAVRTLLFPLHLLLDQRFRKEVGRSIVSGNIYLLLLCLRYTEPLSFFIDKDMHGIEYAQQERAERYQFFLDMGMEPFWDDEKYTIIDWEKKND